MIPVLVSQRVDVIADRGERRDALDQRVLGMLAQCGLVGIPVPNRPLSVSELWTVVRPGGVVLTGGNDLVICGGDSPERDDTEWALLDHAVERQVPVFGICRGLQAIAVYFGAQLQRVEGHVAVRHSVSGELGSFETNSYHAFAPASMPETLHATAYSEDGHVEALKHVTLPVAGVMWHPEREARTTCSDRVSIENHFAASATLSGVV